MIPNTRTLAGYLIKSIEISEQLFLLTYHFLNVFTSRGQTVSVMKKCDRTCIVTQNVLVGSTAISIDSMFPIRIPLNMTQDRPLSEAIMIGDVQHLAYTTVTETCLFPLFLRG